MFLKQTNGAEKRQGVSEDISEKGGHPDLGGVGDRFDEQVRAIPDVGGGAKKDRAQGDGGQGVRVVGGKRGHILGVQQV